MEPKFQTSFIPKKPIGVEPSGIKVIQTINIFSLIAIVLFLVTVIISGGLFVYKRVILSQIAEAKKNIEQARGAIEPDKIKELVDANSRIISSKNLLENHIASSQILFLLQNLTVKRMRINELTYKNNEKKVDLIMKGEIQTYNALAQQEAIFKESEYLKNPAFTNISLNQYGGVEVEFSSTLDPSLISYKKAIEKMSSNQ